MTEPGPPAWTIVVPTRDRPTLLASSVAALERLIPPPGGFEIVVVDDGGRADLGFLDARPGIRLHRQQGAGPAAARNTGAALARGDFLAFTDDDCRPAPDWLLRLAEALALQPEALVGGATFNAVDGNLFSEASQQLATFFYVWQSRTGPRFFASNNFALRRDGFVAVGGFDPSYPLAAGEDRAFCAAWADTERPLVYIPEARVMHHHVLGPVRFWRQHERYGRGAYRFYRERSARETPGRPRSRTRMTLALLTQPFRQPAALGLLARCGCAFLLLLSQVATTVGYLRGALAHGRATSTADCTTTMTISGRRPWTGNDGRVS